MSAQTSADDRARQEAADWFARLNTKTITTAELRAFRTWRGSPANSEAYADVEAVWKAAEHLRHDPDIGDMVRTALTKTPPRHRLRDWLHAVPPAGRISALVAVGLGAVLLASGVMVSQAGQIYRSGLGEQRIVRLEDGSQVRLDTNTQLTVRFAKAARRVELSRGQAFFDVAHDATRPFTVRADGAEVRAVGTRFDVRRDGSAVQVTLVEGRVQVRQAEGGGAWTMDPGQQLRLGSKPAATPPEVQRIDAAAATSWTDGRLTFHAMPLSAAIAEVNRYGRQKVTLEAADLSERAVSGAFDTGNTEAFVAAVSELYGLQADRRPDGQIVLRRSGPGPS